MPQNTAPSKAAKALWRTVKRSLTGKEKLFITLGLLRVSVSNTRLASVDSQSSLPVREPRFAALTSPVYLNDIELSTFLDTFKNRADGDHVVYLKVFEKHPKFLKFARAILVLLGLGVQIGLAIVSL
ncbi:hypothetical protein BJX70DRAFT_396874 [Aspergillus crustosus]